jgi:hypothetical protein
VSVEGADLDVGRSARSTDADAALVRGHNVGAAIRVRGSPAARIDIGGELDTAVSLAIENGRITKGCPSSMS